MSPVVVVVVALHEALRTMLHDLLIGADHYAVTEVADETAALAALAQAAEGVVVVISIRDADHHRSTAVFAAVITAVVADTQLATRHQFLMLSTNPARMPASLQTDLARLHTGLLAKPFVVDALLAAVRDAEARLVPVPDRQPAPAPSPASTPTPAPAPAHRKQPRL